MNLNSVLLLTGLCRLMYKTWMESTYDKQQKSIFLCDYWTKSDGVFTEMQIISYSFIILKHIQIDLHFESYWCWKSDCNFFGTNGTVECNYKEVGYKTTRLIMRYFYFYAGSHQCLFSNWKRWDVQQLADPSSLCFFVVYPDIMRNLI